jgi:nicotinamidase-related amidase
MNKMEINDSCFVLIDMQEKLVGAMCEGTNYVENQELLLKTAAVLDIDCIVTEQYPKGLGNTVDELKCLLPEAAAFVEKTSFSCWGEPKFRTELKSKKRGTVVVFGIEAHVCVMQTVLDLLDEGYKVVVAADALSSRNDYNHRLALGSMRQAGAEITSSESIVFMFLKDAKHPNFREISKFVK